MGQGTNYVALFYINGKLEKVAFSSKKDLANFLYEVTDGVDYEEPKGDENCRYKAWNGEIWGKIEAGAFTLERVTITGDEQFIDFCLKKHGPLYGMTPVLMINEHSQNLLGTSGSELWKGGRGGEMISSYSFYRQIGRRALIESPPNPE